MTFRNMREISMLKQYFFRLVGIGLVGGCLAGAVPAIAHHAFGAEFDPNRPLVLRGPVTRVEWVNPHTWIHMEVTNEDELGYFRGEPLIIRRVPADPGAHARG